MRDLFNLDSPVMRALSRIADLMILNIIFVICCIPIVTIGAAVTAMSYVTLKMKDDEGYVVRSFFKSFRQNFKQSTAIWLILLAAGALLVGDLFILRSMQASFANVVRVVVLFGMFIWMMEFTYVFPLQARFYNSIRATMKNALLLAIANLPRTVLMIAVQVGAVVATFLSEYTLWYGLLIWFMIAFALISYLNSTLLYKVFEKLMPEEEAPGDDWSVDGEEGGVPAADGEPALDKEPAADNETAAKPEE